MGISLLGTAETLIIGNQASKALFGTDLIPFLTEGWLTNPTGTNPTVGGGTANSWGISLKELVQGMVPGGQGYGIAQSSYSGTPSQQIMKVMSRNLKTYGAQAIVTSVATPVMFKFARKVFRRPIRAGNRLLKGSGVRI
jgi:hypothetical protein